MSTSHLLCSFTQMHSHQLRLFECGNQADAAHCWASSASPLLAGGLALAAHRWKPSPGLEHLHATHSQPAADSQHRSEWPLSGSHTQWQPRSGLGNPDSQPDSQPIKCVIRTQNRRRPRSPAKPIRAAKLIKLIKSANFGFYN